MVGDLARAARRTVSGVNGLEELALSRHVHDRVAGQRVDEAWLAERWADPDTRVLQVWDGRVPVAADNATFLRFVSPERAGPGERVLLGVEGGTTYFAVLLENEPEEAELAGIRDIAVGLGDRDAGLLVHAIGVANWHRSHRYCSRCGGVLESAAGGHVRRCGSCGRTHFPRTDPAVIMLVTDGDERCLLGHNTRFPPDTRRFSTLAGFVEPGESLEHAVARELMEEAGISVMDVRYFSSQPWPLPASLMVGFFATATTTEITVDGEEISEARWFTRAELLDCAQRGEIVLPGHISIARRLIESWYGGPLPGSW
ncbi:MAG: NAD(+) diphosphatase [Propionibacteriales bacterium]|nr:NAD(+) diphosphatase [Propionibacteriales bacterium]